MKQHLKAAVATSAGEMWIDRNDKRLVPEDKAGGSFKTKKYQSCGGIEQGAIMSGRCRKETMRYVGLYVGNLKENVTEAQVVE